MITRPTARAANDKPKTPSTRTRVETLLTATFLLHASACFISNERGEGDEINVDPQAEMTGMAGMGAGESDESDGAHEASELYSQLHPEIVLREVDQQCKAGYQVHYFEILNPMDFPSELFYEAPDLPPCGTNTRASRSWVEIRNSEDMWVVASFCYFDTIEDLLRAGINLPCDVEEVYFVIHDRLTGERHRSASISL